MTDRWYAMAYAVLGAVVAVVTAVALLISAWLDRRSRRRCLTGQVSRTEQRIAARKGEP